MSNPPVKVPTRQSVAKIPASPNAAGWPKITTNPFRQEMDTNPNMKPDSNSAQLPVPPVKTVPVTFIVPPPTQNKPLSPPTNNSPSPPTNNSPSPPGSPAQLTPPSLPQREPSHYRFGRAPSDHRRVSDPYAQLNLDQERVYAILNMVIIAEADRHDIILMGGNTYFPPEMVRQTFLTEIKPPQTYDFVGKGVGYYYNIKRSDGTILKGGAWRFQHTNEDFSVLDGFFAFWRGVKIA